MSTYPCEECGSEFPGGTQGSTFVVSPQGRTDHLCSGACLRAWVNKTPLAKYQVYSVVLGMVLGAVLGSVTTAFLR